MRICRRLNVVFRDFDYPPAKSTSEAIQFTENNYWRETNSNFWKRCQRAMSEEQMRKDDETLAKYK